MTISFGWVRPMWANARHGLSKFFASVSVLVGALGFCSNVFSLISLSANAQQIIQTLSLSAISLISLGTLACREVVLGRKAKFASTLDRQQAASVKIKDLYCFLIKGLDESQNSEEKERTLRLAKVELKSILDEYSSIFSQLISQRCRICIKVLCFEGSEPYVYTLARESLSAKECCKDDAERERTKFDLLNLNNFLVKMFDNDQPDETYFFSNDLTAEKHYEPSSVKFKMIAAKETCSVNRRKWYLPYKSAMVMPIKQDAREDLDVAEGQEMIVGFVGIDSPSRWAFSEPSYVPLAQSFASSLFPILRRYAEVDAHP